MAKKKTGVFEWAEESVNIQLGCEHNCLYCYARYDAVSRYHRCTQEQWENPVINQKKVDLSYHKKIKAGVMFPSTHDITPKNLSEYLCVLRKLLDAGNQVLIVSKPHWDCITVICENYTDYKDQITFRFTIGSASEDVLKFWEPGAPNLTERLSCLEYAYRQGYKTSVSCEPYLDAWPSHVYVASEQWITGTFWLGKMRNFKSRVDFSKSNAVDITKYVVPLINAQEDSVVLTFVEQMKDWRGVMFKDSVQAVIDKHRIKQGKANAEAVVSGMMRGRGSFTGKSRRDQTA